MTDLEKELVRGIVKNEVSKAMNSEPKFVKTKSYEEAKKDREKRYTDAEKKDKDDDKSKAKNADRVSPVKMKAKIHMKSGEIIDVHEQLPFDTHVKYAQKMKDARAVESMDGRLYQTVNAVSEALNAPSFEKIMENPEAKKLVEAIEHGSSDKELLKDLKDKLFKKYGYKYVGNAKNALYNPVADPSYKNYRRQIDDEIRKLQQKLSRMDDSQKSDPKNWGSVGDANQILNSLKEISR